MLERFLNFEKKFCWAVDIINCGRVSKGLYNISINEQLWRAKLYADFAVCDEMKSLPAREAYLKLASSGHPNCNPLKDGVMLVDAYHRRARKWLEESIKVFQKGIFFKKNHTSLSFFVLFSSLKEKKLWRRLVAKLASYLIPRANWFLRSLLEKPETEQQGKENRENDFFFLKEKSFCLQRGCSHSQRCWHSLFDWRSSGVFSSARHSSQRASLDQISQHADLGAGSQKMGVKSQE